MKKTQNNDMSLDPSLLKAFHNIGVEWRHRCPILVDGKQRAGRRKSSPAGKLEFTN